MHSNEMHTARLLTIFQHALGAFTLGMFARGVFARGVSAHGVSTQGGCLPGWVPVRGGVATYTCRGQTDTCENITFVNFVCGR